jgi:RHH-type proline utilization regulon transcriptional repressor/proline dehydrogenase/delta 1-pyrroline-5-carboxylate dehydrogenase
MSGDLQAKSQDHGRRLFAGVRARRPWPLTRPWIDDLGMAWTMRDERLKVQLFRFVDALPGLAGAEAIATHLVEYLQPVAGRLPIGLGALLPTLRRRGRLAPLAAWAARVGVHQLARKFIAGSDLRQIIATVARLRADHLAFTVDLLGEAVVSDEEAERYHSAYVHLIDGLAEAAHGWAPDDLIDRDHRGSLPRVNVSLKLSALVSRFDPADPQGSARAVRARLEPLLRHARRRGVFVNIDMEQNAYRALTLDILTEVLDQAEFRGWSDVGVAIQAYLRCSGDDLARLQQWVERRGTPLWVRLVKGAYHDYERVVAGQRGWPVPVFTDKAATDANYEALCAFLLAHHDTLRPAFASHNVRSIAHVLALAEERQVPTGAFEFQMLYGMADPLKAALVEQGQRVRIYAPYGRLLPGMAYLVRRLLENTSNQSFVRAGFLEHRDQEELLMRPRPTERPASPETPARGFTNEPLLDFSIPENRAACSTALSALRERLPLHCPAVIGGRQVATRETLVSLNPSHLGEVVAVCASAGEEQAREAIAAAHAAYPAWRDRPVEERAELVRRLGAELLARRHALAALIVLESGKNMPEADAEVCEAIDFCRYYAAEMLRLAQPRERDLPGEHNRMIHEPRGVAAVIAPWNFPLAILCGMTTAALVAGNTVVMKPAEQTPAVAGALMQAIEAAGFPAGVANLLPGDGAVVGPLLVTHPQVSLIAFTGSLEVGLAINRQAAAATGGDEVKRVICEMGGKNAIIVDADADLDEAVLGVLHSSFDYQGQKCSACSRVIVLDPIHDRFVQRLIAATRSLTMGPAEDASAAIGPVIDDEARERILARIAEARGGATLAYAGEAPALDGCFVAPHIFTGVDPSSSLAQDEIFGPVLAVLRAKDLGHALSIANGTRFALTGGFYSRSPTAIERVTREFRVGNLYLNRRITGAMVDVQPFGGFKLSGIGSKAGGPDYLLQFVVPRCVSENTMRHGFTPDLAS